MRIKVLFLSIVLIVVSFAYSKKKEVKIPTEVLQPVKAITGEDDPRIFVRWGGYELFTVDENRNIYISTNLSGYILKVNNKGEFVKKIGRKGQGPGDLNLPTWVKYIDGKIIVSDEVGYSFFDTNGRFLHKFRTFLPFYKFAVDSKYIYAYLPREKNIITVFDFKGNKVKSFGKRFSCVNPRNLKYGTMMNLYSADIMVTDKYVYLLYNTPALLYQYDKKGNFIRKRFIEFYYDKNIQGVAKEIREIVFKKGYDGKRRVHRYYKETGITAIYVRILESGIYNNGKFYLIPSLTKYYLYKGKTYSYSRIIMYDEKTLKAEKEYIYYTIIGSTEYGKDSDFGPSPGHFQVIEAKGGEKYFFIPVVDRVYDGAYLGIYKTKK